MARLPLAILADVVSRLWRRPALEAAPGHTLSRLTRSPASSSIWLVGRLYIVDAPRRFGLIDAEDGRIVYFHLDCVADAHLPSLTVGAVVLFDEKSDRLGRQARTVFPVSAIEASAAPPLRVRAAHQGAQPADIDSDAGRSRSVA